MPAANITDNATLASPGNCTAKPETGAAGEPAAQAAAASACGGIGGAGGEFSAAEGGPPPARPQLSPVPGKEAWPELVGRPTAEAQAVIQQERPDLTVQVAWAEGAAGSAAVAPCLREQGPTAASVVSFQPAPPAVLAAQSSRGW